ncbi:hypothetical protein ACT17Q_15650 [Cellulomonas sp. CW35]|uniref:hypothetical protein n=1 Tax=Cellulomonas sp. CW35 TaxID=3458249 RepID=UPI004033C6D8
MAHVAVPLRAPRSVVGVRFVSRAARSERVRQDLSALEVAVLEVLESWQDVVEVPDAAANSVLWALCLSGRIDPVRLVAAATTEPRIVRTRLADLLRSMGREDLASAISTGDRGGRR